MMNKKEKRHKDAVPRENILSQVGLFQVPRHHKNFISKIWKTFCQTSSGLGTVFNTYLLMFGQQRHMNMNDLVEGANWVYMYMYIYYIFTCPYMYIYYIFTSQAFFNLLL